jgi:hypothetical protein
MKRSEATTREAATASLTTVKDDDDKDEEDGEGVNHDGKDENDFILLKLRAAPTD